MPISFRCTHCGKQVEAPDAAAGKRGKCPFCKETNYIPLPADQRDVIPLEDIDEDEERRRQEEIRRLRQAEKEFLADNTPEAPAVPLEHKENLSAADLYHFAINYCLDMSAGKLDRAALHVEKLRKFGPLALDAVVEIASGRYTEPAIKHIPAPVLKGYCKKLREQLAEKK